jgi:hypothetical protein
MLSEPDRLFLGDFVSYICFTHPIAALALHRAAVAADEIAPIVEGLMHPAEPDVAARRAVAGNTAALVQTHVTARLLGQLAAAIEDCGALGDAIRHRDRKGLLRRYLESQGGAVGVFWDLVVAGTPLPDLLAVPDLGSLDSAHREAVQVDYEQLTLALREIAGIYRGHSTPGHWAEPGETVRPDTISIVMDVRSKTAGAEQPPPITLLAAYNKVKHRFPVVEHATELGAAIDAQGDELIIGAYPRNPTQAELLVLNTVAVARASGGMAALVLKLTELGVLPPGR